MFKHMLKMSGSKGFTLIELLVVIAIIGILSSVVLASLNSARQKGADAAVKSNLATIRVEAELSYDDNGDYDAVCGESTVVSAGAAAAEAGNGTFLCFDEADEWAASTELRTGDYWCVDSGGTATTSISVLGTDETVCP